MLVRGGAGPPAGAHDCNAGLPLPGLPAQICLRRFRFVPPGAAGLKPHPVTAPAKLAPPPSLAQLFVAFARIGMTSFGGGISGWMRLEFVVRKRWLTEDNFLLGLSLSQALPGVNVVNLPIWIGYELRGTPGAIAAVSGLVIPSVVLVVLISMFVTQFTDLPLTHLLLAGITATAIGFSLSIGLYAAYRRARDITSIGVMVATFAALFIFKLPTAWILAVMAPLSIALAWYKIKRDARS
jgi:chromate transporter